jgi:hypothetical protein
MSDAALAGDSGDMTWRSAKIRMARMVDSIGCDTFVDHVFLFQVPGGRSGLATAIAIGRSLEREETEGVLAQWRLVEVKRLDVVSANDLDGAEVYYEMSEVDESDVVPFDTAFHPERSRPVPRRLMTVGQQEAGSGMATWFSAKIRVVSLIEGRGSHSHDDSVYVFRATSFDDAFDRAVGIGRARERDYVNMEQERVRRRLVEVSSLNLLGAGKFGNAADVYNEAVPVSAADRVPFDTVFHPERSRLP